MDLVLNVPGGPRGFPFEIPVVNPECSRIAASFVDQE